MARQDFTLHFGSNAPEFGKQLTDELSTARSALNELATHMLKIDRAVRKDTGGGGFDEMVAGIGEANLLIGNLVGELQGMASEFRNIAASMKDVARASRGIDTPSPDVTVDNGKSRSGRVSKTAQRNAEKDRAALSQDVEIEIETGSASKTTSGKGASGQARAARQVAKSQVERLQAVLEERGQTVDQLIADIQSTDDFKWLKRLQSKEAGGLGMRGAKTGDIEQKRAALLKRIPNIAKSLPDARPDSSSGADEAATQALTENAQAEAQATQEVVQGAQEETQRNLEELTAHRDRLRKQREDLGYKPKSGRMKGKWVAKPHFGEEFHAIDDEIRATAEEIGIRQGQEPKKTATRKTTARKTTKGATKKTTAPKKQTEAPAAEEALEEVAEESAQAEQEIVQDAQESAQERADRLVARQNELKAERQSKGYRRGNKWVPKDKADGPRVKEITSELRGMDSDVTAAVRASREASTTEPEAKPEPETKVVEEVEQQREEAVASLEERIQRTMENENISREELLRRINEGGLREMRTLGKAENLDINQDIPKSAKTEEYRETAQTILDIQDEADQQVSEVVDDALEEQRQRIQETIDAVNRRDSSGKLALNQKQLRAISTEEGAGTVKPVQRNEDLAASITSDLQSQLAQLDGGGTGAEGLAQGQAQAAQSLVETNEEFARAMEIVRAASGKIASTPKVEYDESDVELRKIWEESGGREPDNMRTSTPDAQALIDPTSRLRPEDAQRANELRERIAQLQRRVELLSSERELIERGADTGELSPPQETGELDSRPRRLERKTDLSRDDVSDESIAYVIDEIHNLRQEFVGIQRSSLSDRSLQARNAIGEEIVELVKLVDFLTDELGSGQYEDDQKSQFESAITDARSKITTKMGQLDQVDQGGFDEGVGFVQQAEDQIAGVQSEMLDVRILMENTADEGAKESLQGRLDELRTNMRELQDRKNEFVNRLINEFPIEALTRGADTPDVPEALERLPIDTSRWISRRERGVDAEMLRSAGVSPRRILGSGGNVRIPENTKAQRREPGALTKGQLERLPQTLVQMENVDLANQSFEQEKVMEARRAAAALLAAKPDISTDEINEALKADKGVTSEAARAIRNAIEFLDEMAVIDPDVDGRRLFSAERVAGAQQRDPKALERRNKAERRQSQLRGREGETDALTKRQRRGLNKKDVTKALNEMLYGDQQVSGAARGEEQVMLRLFGRGGFMEQAETPEQQQAVARLRDAIKVAAAKGAKAGPMPSMEELYASRRSAVESGDEDEIEKVNKQLEKRRERSREERESFRAIDYAHEDVLASFQRSADPKRAAEMEAEREKREKARIDREAREELGLDPAPIKRRFNYADPEDFERGLGIGRDRTDPALIEEKKGEREVSRANVKEQETALTDARKAVSEARESYERLARAADEAAKRLEQEQQKPPPEPEPVGRARETYESAREAAEQGAVSMAELSAMSIPELRKRATAMDIPGRSKITKRKDLEQSIFQADPLRQESNEAYRRIADFERENPLVREPVDVDIAARAAESAKDATDAKAAFEGLNAELREADDNARNARGRLSNTEQELTDLRGQDLRGQPDSVLKFERLNDLIRQVESGDITTSRQIPSDRADEFSLREDDPQAYGPFLPDLEGMKRQRLALMRKQIDPDHLVNFNPNDPRFTDPELTPEQFSQNLGQFRQEQTESGLTPEEAAERDFAAQKELDAPNKEQLDLVKQRIAQERAAEQAARTPKASEGGGSFKECCDRIVAAINKVSEILRNGVRISGSGKGPSTRTSRVSPTNSEMRAQLKERGITVPESMRKSELQEALEKSEPTAAQKRQAAKQVPVESEKEKTDRREISRQEILRGLAQADERDPRDKRRPSRQEQFEGLVGDGDILPEEAIQRATELAALLKESGVHLDQARKQGAEQFNLTDEEDIERLRERLQWVQANAKGEAELEANKNRKSGTQDENQLMEYQLRILGNMNEETQRAVMMARDLAKARAQGVDGLSDSDVQDARSEAIRLMDRDLSERVGPSGNPVLGGTERNTIERGLLGASSNDFNDAAAQATGEGYAQALAQSVQREGPSVQKTMSNALFGESGFMMRSMRSIGTFMVRNMTAGMVFGVSRLFRQMLQDAIETEAQFIRISDALEATGRTAEGVRTSLMSISTDLGVPLQEVFEIASNITGAFDDVSDIEFGTRIVAQMEMISQGALNAKEGFDALQTIAASFDLEGVRELERIQDTAVAIQNVMAIGIEDTIQGIGGLAGTAAELNISLEETGVLVAAISKGTNQGGKASAEQFGRILSTFSTAKGRNVMIDAGVGNKGMFAENEIGTVVLEMIRNWDDLTAAQQRNIKATFGSRREARAFNALINRREQILSTLIETENAHGLGQQRVEEIMRELANQIKIAGTNFTNFGAVLVRSGLLDFFGLMLRGVNSLAGTLNNFLSLLNDIADSHPLLDFARSAISLMGGLAISVTGVTFAVDALAKSLAAQAIANNALAGATAIPVIGGRVAAQAALMQGGAAAAAGRTPTRAGGLLAGATAGVLGVGRRNARLGGSQPIPMQGGVPKAPFLPLAPGTTPIKGTASTDALLAASLLGGRGTGQPGRMKRGVDFMRFLPQRGAQAAGGVIGGTGRAISNVALATAAAAPAGMALKAGGAAKAGAALTKLGSAIGGLAAGTAATAAGVLMVLAGAIKAVADAGAYEGERGDAAENLLIPLMSDEMREETEERRIQDDLGWFARWTQDGKDARAEQEKARFEELQKMSPGERMIAENDDEDSWWKAQGRGSRWMFNLGIGQTLKSPAEIVQEAYDEEVERLAGEVMVGGQSEVVEGEPPNRMRGTRTLGEFGADLDAMYSVDDDDNITINESQFSGSTVDSRMEQLNSERNALARATQSEIDALQQLRNDGDIDDLDYEARAAAIVEAQRAERDKLDTIERGILGQRDINRLMASEVTTFNDALSTLEGLPPAALGNMPNLDESLDLILKDLIDDESLDDSSWMRILNELREGDLSQREFAELIQEGRVDVLDEMLRNFAEDSEGGEMETDEEKQRRAEIGQQTQTVAQGHQELWDNAVSTASELAGIAAEMSGQAVETARAAVARAITAIEEQLAIAESKGDEGDAEEIARLRSSLATLGQTNVDLGMQKDEGQAALMDARSDDSLASAQRGVDLAAQRLRDARQEAMERGLHGDEHAAFIREAQINLYQAQDAEAGAINGLADAALSFAQAETEDPRLQAALALSAAVQARDRYDGEDQATLWRLETEIMQARRAQRDAINELAAAEMELGLSQEQDPREQALIRLRDATRQAGLYSASGGDNQAEIDRLEAQIIGAERELLQSARADRDAAAQTRIAMERDPEQRLLMEMQVARVQMAEAAEQGTAAYEAARQNLIGLEQSLEDQRQAIRMGQFQLRMSTTEDPLISARLQVEMATEEMRQAMGAQERQSAFSSIVAARQAEADAVWAMAEAQLNLASAIAGVDGNQVRAAQIALEQARSQLRMARERGSGDAAIAAAQAATIQAEGAMRDAVLQDQLDTIEFNRTMGVITQGQSIEALNEILATMDLTREQRRGLLTQIKGLQDDLAAQLTGSGFNIPTEIELPTAYQVRRSLGINDMKTDRLPDEWADLSMTRVDIEPDLTEPLSNYEDAIGTSSDRIVTMAREGAGAAIDAILEEYDTLGPQVTDSLAVLAQAQDAAWAESQKSAVTGAKLSNQLSLSTIEELSAPLRAELDGIRSAQVAAWEAANEAALSGGQKVAGTMIGTMRTGVDGVIAVVAGFNQALADAINPVIEATGGDPIRVHSQSGPIPGTTIGGLFAKGGFSNEALPGSATIQSPQGRGLIQWAESSTGGEAFIPLGPANRARSMQIWEETGRRLGVESFAQGGLRSPNRDNASGGRYGGWTANLAPYVMNTVAQVLNSTPGGQTIVSAYRTPEHNRSVGGAPNSDHMTGHAVDVGPLGPALDSAFARFASMPSVRWISPPGTYRSHRHVSFLRRGFVPDHNNVTHTGVDGSEGMGAWTGGYVAQDGTYQTFTMPAIPDTPEGLIGDVGTLAMASMAATAQALMGSMIGGMSDFADGTVSSGSMQEIVKSKMREHGFGMEQWPALANLVQRESSWNANAQNPNSTAYGLFQFLNSTWAGTGIGKTPDPVMQAEAGMRYIKGRYGTPQAAWDHWQRRVPINGQDVGNWYRSGGIFDEEAIIGVGEAGPEAVIPLNGDGVRFMSQLINDSVSKAGFDASGNSGAYVDARQLVSELSRVMGTTDSRGGDTNVTNNNTFHQSVQSPAQIRQVAQAVIDLLGTQMASGARSRSASPRLVGTGGR